MWLRPSKAPKPPSGAEDQATAKPNKEKGLSVAMRRGLTVQECTVVEALRDEGVGARHGRATARANRLLCHQLKGSAQRQRSTFVYRAVDGPPLTPYNRWMESTR